MDVKWTATSPATGRYSGLDIVSSDADLLSRIAELRARGAGYVEVRIADQDFPAMSLAFQGERAVIERWTDEEHMALLGGDGSVPMDEEVDVPLEDDHYPATYTGEFVSSIERALTLVQQFIRTGDAESLGDWYDL